MLRRGLWVALLVVVGLPTGLVFWEHCRGDRLLAAKLAELRSRAERLEIGELVPPAPPKASNGILELQWAAPRLQEASRIAPPSLRVVLPGRAIPAHRFESWEGSPRTNYNWGTIDAWILQHEADLNQAHAALDLPSCRAILDYSKGFGMSLGPLAQLKSVAYAFGIAGVHAAREGDFEAAVADLQAMVRVESSLSREPLMISQLVRASCASIAVNRAWDVLHARQWNDAQLHQLEMTFPESRVSEGMAHALEGERALFLISVARLTPAELGDMLTGNGTGAGGGGTSSLQVPDSFESAMEFAGQMTSEMAVGARRVLINLWRFTWEKQSIAHYLEVVDRMLASSREAVAARSKAVFEDLDVERLVAPNNLLERMRTLYSQTLGSTLTKAMEKGFIADVQRQCLRTDIALQRYCLRHGEYPQALDALVPEFLDAIPIDSMDGKPMRYRRNPDQTFTLWSVGEDGRDDGGDSSPRGPAASSVNWWRCADAVWPIPVSDEEFHAWRTREDLNAASKAARRRRPGGPNPTPVTGESVERHGPVPPTPPSPAASSTTPAPPGHITDPSK